MKSLKDQKIIEKLNKMNWKLEITSDDVTNPISFNNVYPKNGNLNCKLYVYGYFLKEISYYPSRKDLRYYLETVAASSFIPDQPELYYGRKIYFYGLPAITYPIPDQPFLIAIIPEVA